MTLETCSSIIFNVSVEVDYFKIVPDGTGDHFIRTTLPIPLVSVDLFTYTNVAPFVNSSGFGVVLGKFVNPTLSYLKEIPVNTTE